MDLATLQAHAAYAKHLTENDRKRLLGMREREDLRGDHLIICWNRIRSWSRSVSVCGPMYHDRHHRRYPARCYICRDRNCHSRMFLSGGFSLTVPVLCCRY